MEYIKEKMNKAISIIMSIGTFILMIFLIGNWIIREEYEIWLSNPKEPIT